MHHGGRGPPPRPRRTHPCPHGAHATEGGIFLLQRTVSFPFLCMLASFSYISCLYIALLAPCLQCFGVYVLVSWRSWTFGSEPEDSGEADDFSRHPRAPLAPAGRTPPRHGAAAAAAVAAAAATRSQRVRIRARTGSNASGSRSMAAAAIGAAAGASPAHRAACRRAIACGCVHTHARSPRLRWQRVRLRCGGRNGGQSAACASRCGAVATRVDVAVRAPARSRVSTVVSVRRVDARPGTYVYTPRSVIREHVCQCTRSL